MKKKCAMLPVKSEQGYCSKGLIKRGHLIFFLINLLFTIIFLSTYCKVKKSDKVQNLNNEKKAERTRPENFVYVPGGTFNMGDEIGIGKKDNGSNDERPVHSVTAAPFYISKYEVTQKEWMELMDNNPSGNTYDENLPVETINWYECIEYCNKRSLIAGLDPCYKIDKRRAWFNFNKYDNLKWKVTIIPGANGYRLPTEEEWEFAARYNDGKEWTPSNYTSGAAGPYDELEAIDKTSWYEVNSMNSTHPIGTKAPNQLGIYDMSGNVWEWCWSSYLRYPGNKDKSKYYSKYYRVLRGGAWNYEDKFLRVTNRTGHGPTVKNSHYGLRLVIDS